MKRTTIAVTMGDPAGIGPEILLGALGRGGMKAAGRGVASGRRNRGPGVSAAGASAGGSFLVIGDFGVLDEVNRSFEYEARLERVTGPEQLVNFGPEDGVIPVLDVPAHGCAGGGFEPGRISADAGRASVAYIRKAVDLARAGEVQGIVTGPINKEALREAEVPFAGHTELLAHYFEASGSITMFEVENLRIFFHTRHVSLRNVLDSLDIEGVVKSLRSVDRCLASISGGEGGKAEGGERPGSIQGGGTDGGVSEGGERPGVHEAPRGRRIALAALNPHASDGGMFGSEEQEVLEPAAARTRELGMDVHGPVPADSVFNMALEGRFDAVLSLYHDQGHIAAKTYDFYRTVSVTFGLPVIRTSVDHGTAFDIAWQGKANPVSMTEALASCVRLAALYRPVELEM